MMTKAEQKKLEKKKREALVKKAFGCVLDAIFEASGGLRGSPQTEARPAHRHRA